MKKIAHWNPSDILSFPLKWQAKKWETCILRTKETKHVCVTALGI